MAAAPIAYCARLDMSVGDHGAARAEGRHAIVLTGSPLGRRQELYLQAHRVRPVDLSAPAGALQQPLALVHARARGDDRDAVRAGELDGLGRIAARHVAY